ncbi:MAG: hypothetical protein CMJ46_04235 [Planctomyces sp.]|nr:hypothetical protein [Planctomyces sp.]
MSWTVYQSIGISLALGLLVGLQRQYSNSDIAGIRTFALITLLGTVCAVVTEERSTWLTGAALLAVAIVLFVHNLAQVKLGDADMGMTTEVAALLMFGVGVMVGEELTGPAIVTAGIAAVLLHWKKKLHGLVGHMTENDIRGVMHLTLIGLVILPVLPDETYGPYEVLNPYSIWRMVVLIVGISMTAYVAQKVVGPRAGAVLGGILGGFISSTATTVSYARQSNAERSLAPTYALVIFIASTIVNVRVLIEIGIVAPNLLKVAAWPLGLMLLLMVVECGLFLFLFRQQSQQPPLEDNPAQLLPALIFGGLYAVILFVVAAAKDIFGNQALYWIAAISGLTDVDAITLSTANLFSDGRVEAETAWRVVLIATLSNLVFKAGLVGFLGTRKVLLYVVILFAITMAGGIALLVWWPEIDAAIPMQFFQKN